MRGNSHVHLSITLSACLISTLFASEIYIAFNELHPHLALTTYSRGGWGEEGREGKRVNVCGVKMSQDGALTSRGTREGGRGRERWERGRVGGAREDEERVASRHTHYTRLKQKRSRDHLRCESAKVTRPC